MRIRTRAYLSRNQDLIDVRRPDLGLSLLWLWTTQAGTPECSAKAVWEPWRATGQWLSLECAHHIGILQIGQDSTVGTHDNAAPHTQTHTCSLLCPLQVSSGRRPLRKPWTQPPTKKCVAIQFEAQAKVDVMLTLSGSGSDAGLLHNGVGTAAQWQGSCFLRHAENPVYWIVAIEAGCTAWCAHASVKRWAAGLRAENNPTGSGCEWGWAQQALAGDSQPTTRSGGVSA